MSGSEENREKIPLRIVGDSAEIRIGYLSQLGRFETKCHNRTKQNVTVLARAFDRASIIMPKEHTYLQAVSFTSNCMEMFPAAHVFVTEPLRHEAWMLNSRHSDSLYEEECFSS